MGPLETTTLFEIIVAAEANPHSELWGLRDHMKSLAVGKLGCSGLVHPFPDVLVDTECHQPRSLVWGDHHVRMGMKHASSSLQETLPPSLISLSWQSSLGMRHLCVTGPVGTLHSGRSKKAQPNSGYLCILEVSALQLFGSPVVVTSLFQRPTYFWASQTPLLHCVTLWHPPEPAKLDFQMRTVYFRLATGLHQIFKPCYVLKGCYVGKSRHIRHMGGQAAYNFWPLIKCVGGDQR